MKKISVTIIFGFLTIFIQAQEKKEYWDNGNLKSRINYNENGQKDGRLENYYEDGQKKVYGNYTNGVKTGTWREYYYNGEVKMFRGYRNGLQFIEKSYYINGRTMVTGHFDDNERKHGIWEQYYDNWILKLKGEYHHGNKQGQWKYKTNLGKLYKIENYKDGILISKWEGNSIGTTNDRVVEAADATEDVEIVTDVVKESSAAVDAVKDAVGSTRNYYSNRLNGEWKFYNDSGKCIEIGNYKEDKKDGKWKYYYTNGKLKKVQFWKEDKLLEVISHFNKDGVAMERGTLKDGYGTVIEYDSGGKLTVLEYANGEVLDWNNYSVLNSAAWEVYENETDKERLSNALKWVKRSIELDKNYYNTDTHAALLYKMGNNKKALEIAQEAITIAKRDNTKYDETMKLIIKINAKLKSK